MELAATLSTGKYCELQVTTNFSLLRGASHPAELVAQAALLGYSHLGITDLNSLAGIVRAEVAAKECGIRLIVGCQVTLFQCSDALLTDEQLRSIEPLPAAGLPLDQRLLPLSLLIYPTNLAAYGCLTELLTCGKARAPKGLSYLTLNDLLEHHHAGWLAIAVCRDLNNPLLISYLQNLKQLFNSRRLSLAVRRTYTPESDHELNVLSTLSAQLAIPLCATNDVLYHLPQRRPLQDILTCIRLHSTVKGAGFALMSNAERYLKPISEINRLFAKHPDAIHRTQEIAEQCEGFSLAQIKYQYPHETCPADKSPLQHLTKLTWAGAAQHYIDGIPDQVVAQLAHELQLIAELQYEKYFLTVYDIVSFARSQGILCQGRGAAANSAVCFVLGITAVDPTQIKLLFERFVSKERDEPPDIDIDFEHERREEVIQYIYQKYGRHRAALVSEVITYRRRSALRDVGKALGLTPSQIELLIRATRGNFDSSAAAQLAKSTPTTTPLNFTDPMVYHTLQLARELCGFPRHLSQHVGGFVISETKLSSLVPIEPAAMPHRTVIEWDKDDIEQLGMLKIDILGLGMLTCLRKALDLVNNLTHQRLTLHTIPREDTAVYQMISRADTIGVFQIESRAQMSMLPRLRPSCFYDLVIEVAIIRPGPIQGGMVHPYLRRRNGTEPVNYPDDKVRAILERTLGVPIFQEQAMELAVVAAGFTPGEADSLRRAMGSWKRTPNKLLQFSAKLLQGMLQRGYSQHFAYNILEQLKGFGEYGFPQSHAASFALLAYASAWLKLHHPAAFAAALLNSQPMGFYQPAQIIQDAVKHGVEVESIDVNFSQWDTIIEQYPNRLRLGLRLVKGIHYADALKLQRTVSLNGRYHSLRQLWRDSTVTVTGLRALARADAFHSVGLNRQQALWELRKFRDEKLPLLEILKDKTTSDLLPVITPEVEVLKDYHATGLSLKAHPFFFIRQKISPTDLLTANDLQSNRHLQTGASVKVGGIVLVRQRPSTAKGIIFMTIEDETGSINLIIKPQIQERYRSALYDSAVVIARGWYQREQEVIHVVARDLIDISQLIADHQVSSRDFR